jgi:hypothetical protein
VSRHKTIGKTRETIAEPALFMPRQLKWIELNPNDYQVLSCGYDDDGKVNRVEVRKMSGRTAIQRGFFKGQKR